jgi:hypothetical protein
MLYLTLNQDAQDEGIFRMKLSCLSFHPVHPDLYMVEEYCYRLKDFLSPLR